jgi:hypothetical protein
METNPISERKSGPYVLLESCDITPITASNNWIRLMVSAMAAMPSRERSPRRIRTTNGMAMLRDAAYKAKWS